MTARALRLRTAAARRTRAALVRHAQKPPSAAEQAGAERRVLIVLMTAWGMGGTIRTILNLAGHLAGRGYEVEIISVGRARDEPFFGSFPDGVRVVVLDDRRPRTAEWLRHPLRALLRTRSSVLMHPDDWAARGFNLWVDLQLVRRLRGRAGFLMTTRPGLNLIAVRLAAPGLVRVGQEHMNLHQHPEALQEAVTRRYRRLDALTVLTERDRRRYRQHLRRRTPVVRIPNTVRDLGGVRADLSSTTVLAAGRLTRQKGFDRLIKTWALATPGHPDWHLRILGEGPMQERLERMIARNGLEGVVTLAGPARDIGAEMARASIFVLSSRWEGLPLVLLEAMSAGMAVVSFDCPTGPADVIDHRRNGLLVRPRRIAALAAGLGELIEDEELRRRCAGAAVETAREYTIDAVGPQWEALLRETWKRRRTRGGSGPAHILPRPN